MIAPDLAEKYDGQALEKEEAEALRRTTFTMFEDDEGTCHGRFRIPAAQGQMLAKMILAICSPTRSASDTSSGVDPDLPTPVRHGIALTQLIESIPASALPHTGGCDATVVVTMTLDQLMADLDQAGVCTLDTGGRISTAQARRACTAGIIPVVLGGCGRSSTSDANAGCTPKPCAWPCPSETAAAPPEVAKHRRACATPTTTDPGPRAVLRTWRPDGALPPPPQARARPTVRDATTTRRRGQLPPARVRPLLSPPPS